MLVIIVIIIHEQNQFAMVVSAYTLLDQPGQQQQRLEMVAGLWHMTADVLVSWLPAVDVLLSDTLCVYHVCFSLSNTVCVCVCVSLGSYLHAHM